MEDDVKEQDSRPGSVDSDILQGKADVLRAVQATAPQVNNGPMDAASANHGSDSGKKHTIQVEVKPVVAIRPDRDPQSGQPRKESAPPKPAQPDPFARIDAAPSAPTAKEAVREASPASAAQKGANDRPSVEAPKAVTAVQSGPEAGTPAASAAAPQAGAAPRSEAPEPMSSPNTTAVPRFNLGEHILAEQRRAASERRQKSSPGDNAAQAYPAQDTVGEVIREARNNREPVRAAGTEGDNAARHGITLGDGNISAIQRDIISQIVAREIAAFSGRAAGRRTWPRPAAT
jgi:hypothetical protein